MPKDFLGHGIFGHSAVIKLLEAWSTNPAPGYLFYGPQHLGKRLVAERFTFSLLGLDADRNIYAHPDLVVLEPDEGKNIISVEKVRAARLRLSGRPMVAPRLVMFIPRFEQLNEEGTNALLKVLEEPPADAVFVCVAENQARVPATVRSRLVQVPFTPVPRAAIVAGLIERGWSGPEAEMKAVGARGRPGLALSDGSDLNSKAAERFLIAQSLGERLAIIENLAKDCESTENNLEAWNSALDEWGEVFRRRLSDRSEPAIVAGQGVITAKRFVGGAFSPRLPLEAAALRMSSSQPAADLFPAFLPSPYPLIFN